jgi:hypothetical protein
MTKLTRTIIENTLKHYDEMIEWAKEQKPRGRVDEWKMQKGINQHWFSEFCPLCKKFFRGGDIKCGECPLSQRYGYCGQPDIGNTWLAMIEARTWKTWIRHATLMRRQVKSLLEEVKPNAK